MAVVAKAKLMEAYRNVFKGREVPNVTASTVCKVASLRLEAMKLHKSCVSNATFCAVTERQKIRQASLTRNNFSS